MKNRFFAAMLALTALACVFCLCSCSAVFEAGVSGKVYYYLGEVRTYVSGAKVNVYSDEACTDLLASTHTGETGSYTVNSIMWHTYEPEFGKSGDYETVYIKVTHEDFVMEEGGAVAVRIVSNSKNDGMGDIEMRRTRYLLPYITGKLSAKMTSQRISYDGNPENEYDNLTVYLYHQVDGEWVRFSGYGSEATTEMDKEESLSTTYNKYSHGHFTIGGPTLKFSGDETLRLYCGGKYHEFRVTTASTGMLGTVDFDDAEVWVTVPTEE